MRGLSRGPNSSRYRIGCISPMMTQAGLRRFIRSCRRKTMKLSRAKRMSVLLAAGGRRGLRVAQRPSRKGEEDVVEGGAVHLDRREVDVDLVQLAQEPWHGLARSLHAATHVVAVDLDAVDAL